MHDHEKAGSHTGAGNSRIPARRPASAPPAQHGLLGLQAAAGNAGVVQMLRGADHPWAREQHEHGAGCGHQEIATSPAPVQRSAVHDVLRSAGKPLDEPVRQEMEARLGADFSDVRVHDDNAARASATEVGARAYTSGSHVVIGADGGDKHTLAHELTHVIQQRQGPVAGTDMGNGLRVSDASDKFERAAEVNAQRVMQAPLDVQRAVEPRTAPAAGAAHEGVGGPVAVQTAPTDGKRKPPPVPDKPDKLRLGGAAQTSSADQTHSTGHTSAAAEPAQAQSDTPAGKRKPPPVPDKPDKLRLGGAAQTSSADQTHSAGHTSAAAEPAQAQSDTPAHGYTLAGSASLVCFRADGRSPEVIRQANGMRSRNNTSVATELAMFLEDPIAYARAHVSSPKPTLVSTALDEDCGGYASNDRHLYQIQVSGWHKFAAPPARSKILTKPTVYANSTSLETATAAVIGPVGPTQEMDFIGGIPLAAITDCRRPGESGFSAL
ncbi:eCIS core domain-containing protein [Streptomyces sp. CA-106110]|uniref:eCIS core domain-containing protein n=1 Tax=Streptomyces sp. CA-106110 TaxID=3240044 RepID=UPI003D93C284